MENAKPLTVFDFVVKNSKTATDHSFIVTLEMGEDQLQAFTELVKAEVERKYLRAVVVENA
jgi:hypothetical protein